MHRVAAGEGAARVRRAAAEEALAVALAEALPRIRRVERDKPKAHMQLLTLLKE